MAAPAKSNAPVNAAVHASASAHASVDPQNTYQMPSAFTAPEKPTMVLGPPTVAPAPTATEIVERPPPKTLARGRIEAKASTIWIVVVIGAVVLLTYALYRVRRSTRARQRALALATASMRGTPRG